MGVGLLGRVGVFVLLLALGAPVMAQAAGDAPRKATDLVTHSEVTIERPASVVWPYIVDPSQWKQGLPLRHHAGEPGAVGEVFAAYDSADPDTIFFLMKNAELVPNRRRTIKLFLTGAEGPLLGFATWTLTEVDGHTRVTYDLYTESLLPRDRSAAVSSTQLEKMQRQGYARNKPRFDRELAELKRLVESRH